MNFYSKHLKLQWPLVGLFLIVLGIFHRVLFLSETLFAGDIICLYYPVRIFLQKWLDQNIFPLWCPQIYNGFPLLAALQSGVFNPLERIFFTLFSPLYAYNLNVAAHYFLGAVSMYALVKHLTKDQYTAFLAAVCFAFSGYFFLYMTYITIFSACYLPLTFLLAYKCFTRRKSIYVAQLAMILAIQLVAGGSQFTFYSLLAIGFLAVYVSIKPQQTLFSRLIPFIYLTLAVFGFLALTAIQTIPAYELVNNSIRSGGVAKGEWQTASLPLRHLITILIPHFYGEFFRFGNYIGEWNFIDLSCYLGIAPLLLASLPLFMKKKPPLSNFFYFLMAFAVFIALGKFNPLNDYFYYLPGFKSFRFPGRILLLLVFSLAINAGFGYQALQSKEEPTRLKIALYCLTALWLILAAMIYVYIRQSSEMQAVRLNGWYKMNLFFLLGLLPLYWQVFKGMNKHLLFGWLISVILIDNLLFGYPFNPTIAKDVLLEKPGLWQKLADKSKNQRIFAQKTSPFYAIRRAELMGNSDMERLIRSNLELLQGNTVLLSPLSIYQGQDPLELYQQNVIDNQLGLRQLTGKRQLNLFLGRSSAKYLLRWKKQPIKGETPVVYGDISLVYQQPQSLPRAYFAEQHIVLPNAKFALNYLNNSIFNPEKQVILQEKPQNTPPTTSENAQPAEIHLQPAGPNQVIIDVNTSRSGWLVLNDSYYPGWEAYVDGKKTKIYRANLLFRALPISKGKHQVVYRYRPKSWLYGGMISFVSLIGLIIIIVLSHLKKENGRLKNSHAL